jgi:hypothetical protein
MKILLILIVVITPALFSQDNSSENQINEYGGQLWIENRMKSPAPSFTKDSLLTNNPKKKNTGLAIIYSLLLPEWENYMPSPIQAENISRLRREHSGEFISE